MFNQASWGYFCLHKPVLANGYLSLGLIQLILSFPAVLTERSRSCLKEMIDKAFRIWTPQTYLQVFPCSSSPCTSKALSWLLACWIIFGESNFKNPTKHRERFTITSLPPVLAFSMESALLMLFSYFILFSSPGLWLGEHCCSGDDVISRVPLLLPGTQCSPQARQGSTVKTLRRASVNTGIASLRLGDF